jgi:RNA polymerase sigma-70 factor, ECF subfamily
MPDLETILLGCQQKNRLSQKALYQHCYKEMMKVCYRYTKDVELAATVYNDAMLKVFTNIEQYTEQGKLMGWIKRIVLNTCIDFVRLKTPFSTIELKETDNEALGIEDTVLRKLSANDIKKIILTLPQNIATIFNLYVYEEYNHTEIANLLQIPSGTSRYYLSEARRLLKEKITNPIYSLNKL